MTPYTIEGKDKSMVLSMAQSPDTATISLRVPVTLANELKAIANKQRRPLSQMCVFLIEAKLRELQCLNAFEKPFLPEINDDA